MNVYIYVCIDTYVLYMKESDTPLWEKKALVGDEQVSLYVRSIYIYV
jgi:hypothetical protein